MSKSLLLVVLAVPAHAQFRSSLPAPALPGIRVPVLAPAVTPILAPTLPRVSILPSVSLQPTLPIFAAPALTPTAARPAAAYAAAVPAAAAAASPSDVRPAAAAPGSVLPAAARSLQPAVQGRVDWPQVFDGARRVRANAVDAVPAAAQGWSAPEGRHDALVHAANRWRRLLAQKLTATRASDLAGEVRNHLEVYLAQPEPGLPGYGRAAADLKKLLTALESLDTDKARGLVIRFKEDLVHRRSLRITVVLRQEKAGGAVRQSDRFVLPGTTLKTLIARVGGATEKPEVRLDGGEWTAYGRLNLRRKLPDETVVELLLTTGASR